MMFVAHYISRFCFAGAADMMKINWPCSGIAALVVCCVQQTSMAAAFGQGPDFVQHQNMLCRAMTTKYWGAPCW